MWHVPHVGCVNTTNRCPISGSLARWFHDYLYAINGSLFVIHDDGVEVAPKDDGDSSLVLPLRGFTKVDNSATNAWEEPLERCKSLLEPGLLGRLVRILLSLPELIMDFLKLLVQLQLEAPAESHDFSAHARLEGGQT